MKDRVFIEEGCNALLIDFTSIFYRYGFGMKNLITTTGQYNGAIFGTLNLILNLTKTFKFVFIVNCLDSFNNLRKVSLSSYKGNRKPMPDFLKEQILPFLEFIESLNINNILLDGYEADDLIATVATKFDPNYKTFILTCDKDLLQLFSEKSIILLLGKGGIKIIDRSSIVREMFNIHPHQIPDLFALAGDAVDNIKGVKGIGKKTAAILLEEYDTVEHIYKNLDKIEKTNKRIYLLLKDQFDLVLLNKELATTRTYLPIDTRKLISLPDRRISLSTIEKFIDRFELHSIKEKIISVFEI